MHNYIALVLILSVPAYGQLLRGNARTCFSNFHNFKCIPIDGGQVYAWDMQNPASANCQTSGTAVPNNSSFTGSNLGASFNCSGTTPPTIQATGLSIAANGNAILNFNPSFPNGWTISETSKPTSVAAEIICGLDNVDYNVNTTRQYTSQVGYPSSGSVFLGYENAATYQIFSTASATVSGGAWHTFIAGYTSTSANSATIWVNNAKVAGSWTTGTGTPAVPSVQAETDVGTTHSGTPNNCVGTIGYVVAHDHNVNISANGFIYRAFYRAMQFRGVAIP